MSDEKGVMPRRLRVRATGRTTKEWLSRYGGLEGFQRHLEATSVWLYSEPVRVRIGDKWTEAGTQPALRNGEFRILLTDADSDTPTWDYDVEKILPPSRDSRMRAFGGQEVEVEILPPNIVRREEIGVKVAEAAPTVQPISPASPEAPKMTIRKCPKCGVSQKEDVKFCDGCGAQLPEFLVREFAIVFFDGREKLAEFQDARVNAALVLAERGRKISRQVVFDDRYAVILRASAPEASSVEDLDVLRGVFAEFEDGTGRKYGEVLTDSYELKMLHKMLRDQYSESELWRGNEK
jgi:hypothetical protein